VIAQTDTSKNDRSVPIIVPRPFSKAKLTAIDEASQASAKRPLYAEDALGEEKLELVTPAFGGYDVGYQGMR
jgi:hypothetical protein